MRQNILVCPQFLFCEVLCGMESKAKALCRMTQAMEFILPIWNWFIRYSISNQIFLTENFICKKCFKGDGFETYLLLKVGKAISMDIFKAKHVCEQIMGVHSIVEMGFMYNYVLNLLLIELVE